jgi:hypothetical protein
MGLLLGLMNKEFWRFLFLFNFTYFFFFGTRVLEQTGGLPLEPHLQPWSRNSDC